jgi:hypothetical protein
MANETLSLNILKKRIEALYLIYYHARGEIDSPVKLIDVGVLQSDARHYLLSEG